MADIILVLNAGSSSKVSLWVIPANEELMIARRTREVAGIT